MTPLTITVAEAARLAGVHPATVWRWAAAGHFLTYAPGGKRRLVDYPQFVEFIRQSRVEYPAAE